MTKMMRSTGSGLRRFLASLAAIALATSALATSALATSALGAPAPATAQIGPPGARVGIPADPFASNYPSAPPPRAVRPQEEMRRRAIRARPSPEPGLRPPANVPAR